MRSHVQALGICELNRKGVRLKVLTEKEKTQCQWIYITMHTAGGTRADIRCHSDAISPALYYFYEQRPVKHFYILLAWSDPSSGLQTTSYCEFSIQNVILASRATS